MTTFYCLIFETLPTWRARSLYLYPPRTECPSYIPRHCNSFLSPPMTHRATVEVLEPALTGIFLSTIGFRSPYIALAGTVWKTPLTAVPLLLRSCDRYQSLLSNECSLTSAIACLPCHNLTVDVSSSPYCTISSIV
jgi:hypothetical protein